MDLELSLMELLTKKLKLLKGKVIKWEKKRSILAKKEHHSIEEKIILINEKVGRGIFHAVGVGISSSS